MPPALHGDLEDAFDAVAGEGSWMSFVDYIDHQGGLEIKPAEEWVRMWAARWQVRLDDNKQIRLTNIATKLKVAKTHGNANLIAELRATISAMRTAHSTEVGRLTLQNNDLQTELQFILSEQKSMHARRETQLALLQQAVDAPPPPSFCLECANRGKHLHSSSPRSSTPPASSSLLGREVRKAPKRRPRHENSGPQPRPFSVPSSKARYIRQHTSGTERKSSLSGAASSATSEEQIYSTGVRDLTELLHKRETVHEKTLHQNRALSEEVGELKHRVAELEDEAEGARLATSDRARIATLAHTALKHNDAARTDLAILTRDLFARRGDRSYDAQERIGKVLDLVVSSDKCLRHVLGAFSDVELMHAGISSLHRAPSIRKVPASPKLSNNISATHKRVTSPARRRLLNSGNGGTTTLNGLNGSGTISSKLGIRVTSPGSSPHKSPKSPKSPTMKKAR